jgi:3-dehydroquinate synthase
VSTIPAAEAAKDAVSSIRVAVSPPYDVLVGPGLIARAADLIAERLGRARCAIVTDNHVAAHYLPRLEAVLRARHGHAGSVVLAAGEAAKSFAVLAPLCERLLGMGLERRDLLIALGGGVIGDLTGFAASILRRGIRYVQLPTTLLAQVDSAVGGKTAINTPQGKNLIGSFHQPSLVIADTDVLASLPAREFRAGYVEAAKYALLADADYFAWLERNRAAILAQEASALRQAIAVAVAGKAGIVARDERETGERMLLNLGHTFGHALEAWAGYSDRLLHGEAVAIGICLAFRLAAQLGFVPGEAVARVETHFAALDLPTGAAAIGGQQRPDVARLLALMRQDKKIVDGRLTLILPAAIGRAFVSRTVAEETVGAFLAGELAGAPAGDPGALFRPGQRP